MDEVTEAGEGWSNSVGDPYPAPPVKVGIPRETQPGENRVAMVPAVAATVIAAGHQLTLESGAGTTAGYTDEEYREAGVGIAKTTA